MCDGDDGDGSVDWDDPALARYRWWDTYNAAVAGLMANVRVDDLEDIHASASTLANIAHGPLEAQKKT